MNSVAGRLLSTKLNTFKIVNQKTPLVHIESSDFKIIQQAVLDGEKSGGDQLRIKGT